MTSRLRDSVSGSRDDLRTPAPQALLFRAIPRPGNGVPHPVCGGGLLGKTPQTGLLPTDPKNQS
jgi:hypothetical protein